MIERWITIEDKNAINKSLEKDIYHTTTKSDFYYAPGSFCKVYEDEQGPIMFMRGVKSLRIDIQFNDNRDFSRNKQALLEAFKTTTDSAKTAGFTEIIFCTTSPLLKKFCKKIFKFEEIEGDELRLML